MSTRLSALAVAAALALTHASGSHAQSSPVLDAHAGVSNLQVRLIDLDPNDGIEASITWLGMAQASMPETYVYGIAAEATAIRLDPESVAAGWMVDKYTDAGKVLVPLTAPGTWSSVGSLTPDQGLSFDSSANSFEARAAVTAGTQDTRTFDPITNVYTYRDSITGNITTTTYVSTTTRSVAGGSVSLSTPTGDLGDFGFELSPNTLMVLEGIASVSARADLNPLYEHALTGTDTVQIDAQTSTYHSVGGFVSLGAQLSVFLGQDTTMSYAVQNGVSIEGGSGGALSLRTDSSYQQWDTYSVAYLSPEQRTIDQSWSQRFAFAFANVDAEQVRRGALLIDGQVSANQTLTSADVMITTLVTPGTGGGTQPLPEPGTWALMLLGLGGVAAAARRRTA